MVTKGNNKSLGIGFIPKAFLPPDQDEWYLRNRQLKEAGNLDSRSFRKLTSREIDILVKNGNRSESWNKLLVSEGFNPELVERCSFHGLVRIGSLEEGVLEYHDLILPIGMRNCRIISCDIGNNTAIENVAYLANYIIRDEVILMNIDEMVTTNHAKFGNGMVKEGEDPSVLVELEIGNENGGRAVRPFDRMLAGDAWLWSRFRDDRELMDAFNSFTDKLLDQRRGYYGVVDTGTIIKNSRIIKDVLVGGGAYIKGANKLKNLTISSRADAPTQIGEGVELVNGIIGYGCRIFYGVKAVRFILRDHSNLKYGARLINSYLGENSTISCCEVLNAFIAPGHEQHHNNSFLCAATLLGQSNIAAGATIGSNHNSRGPDGEIIAGRGFWPALSTSLKHNSRFASYTLLAKGAYPAELNIPLPFSLISNNEATGQLQILPAYWFRYNMYALARNSWKYGVRDKREDPIQQIEFNYLAPDTVEESFTALTLLELWAGYGVGSKSNNINQSYSDMMNTLLTWTFSLEKPPYLPEELESLRNRGKDLLESRDTKTAAPIADEQLQLLEKEGLIAYGIEKSRRDTIIRRPVTSHQIYRQMIELYIIETLARFAAEHHISFIDGVNRLKGELKKESDLLQNAIPQREIWHNMGGQLISQKELDVIRQEISQGRIDGWESLHQRYRNLKSNTLNERALYALKAFLRLHPSKLQDLQVRELKEAATRSREMKGEISRKTVESREKDYLNGFRTMVYRDNREMEAVLGKVGDNSFIDIVKQEEETFNRMLDSIKA